MGQLTTMCPYHVLLIILHSSPLSCILYLFHRLPQAPYPTCTGMAQYLSHMSNSFYSNRKMDEGTAGSGENLLYSKQLLCRSFTITTETITTESARAGRRKSLNAKRNYVMIDNWDQ